jgi:hypothetical protein
MSSKREPQGADLKARRRRFIAPAGSCPNLPDAPAHAAGDIPREAGAPSVFTRIRAMRQRLSLGRGVSAKDLINEGRRDVTPVRTQLVKDQATGLAVTRGHAGKRVTSARVRAHLSDFP